MHDRDATLTPQIIIEHFERAYREVHGHDGAARHIGGQWYYVNGETVHRFALLKEIARLRELAQHQRRKQTDRSIITRLIAKLRGI
jgi:hypothetical protein